MPEGAGSAPGLDASFRTIRTLADKPSGRTELVRSSGGEVLVRKRIPLALANLDAWRALSQSRSDILPQVRALYELPDELIAVITYADGISLEELVSATGALGVVEAVDYLSQLAEAVGQLHQMGIVHRDLAPANVVVANGHARIIDLGISRAFIEGANKDTRAVGTFGFAAPEQFGFAQTDARSDICSLGSLLGYMVTGLRPSDGGFEAALANEAAVPPDLRKVVDRARSLEPGARYQDAAELSRAASAAAGVAVPQGERGIWEHLKAAAGELLHSEAPNAALPSDVRDRSFREAGPGAQLLVIACWVFSAYWMSSFLSVGFKPEYHTRYSTLAYALMGISGAVACFFSGWEVMHAVLHRGMYRAKRWRVLRLLIRLATFYLLLIVAIIVIIMVC